MKFGPDSKPPKLKKKAISAEEQDLFRQAMRDVKRLENDKVHALKPAPKNKTLFSTNKEKKPSHRAVALTGQPISTQANELLRWQRGGVQQKLMRKLYRGQLGCDAKLDLHGFTVAQARKYLAQLLAQAQQQHFRCLLIVHGKGRGSGHRGPVLKAHLRGWLQAQPMVLAYCSAPPKDGGSGAVYVLLRQKS